MELLTTKFHIPQVDPATQVIREDLLGQMKKALSKRLVWIAAPAGFGKSTFLAQWIGVAGLDDTACWVSLDAGDNDPKRFWTYIMTGFNRLTKGACARALIRLEAADTDVALGNALISMINSLENLEGEWVLVLDDFHLIRDDTILDGLHFLLDHAPGSLTLVAASRRDRFPGISRLKAAGQVLEVTRKELRFRAPEVDAYLGLWAKTPPGASHRDLILQKTEGWAAAITLLLLSCAGDPDGLEQAAGNSHRIVEAYLMEEVFSHLPRDLGSTAAALSLLDRFCPGLIRALEPVGSAPETLLSPALRHQLFLIPLDRDGTWFRFHHLFRDFLKKRPGLPERAGAVHTAAAVWFDKNNCFDEAFDHALKAGRPDLAARFLSGRVPLFYAQSGEQRLNGLFKRLPLEAIRREPVLAAYYYSLKVYSLEFDAIAEFDALVDQNPNPGDDNLLKGFSLCTHAYEAFYRHGDADRVLDLYRRGMALVPEEHQAMRRMMDFLATMCLRFQGEIRQALDLSRPEPHDNMLVSSLMVMNRAALEMELGHLSHAIELLEKEVAAVEACFGRDIPGLFGYLFITYGTALKERREFEKAAGAFERGIAAVRHLAFTELVIISFGEYSLFLAEINSFDQAHAALSHALRLITESGSRFMAEYFSPYKSLIWLKEKKYGLAAERAKAVKLPDKGGISYLHTHGFLAAVRCFIHEGAWEKALAILDALIAEDARLQRNQRLMEAYTLRAKLHWRRKEPEAALKWLSLGLELGRPQGYVNLFLSEFKEDWAFLSAARDRGCLPGYISAFLDRDRPAASPAREVRIHEFTEAFNTREIDILRHFQAGASNRETAEALNLSVNTVRWYASNLFSKLSVKRRGQAVVRAAELGLI